MKPQACSDVQGFAVCERCARNEALGFANIGTKERPLLSEKKCWSFKPIKENDDDVRTR